MTVTNTPDVLSDCVADLAIGMCISISRKLCQSDAFVRSGAWVSGSSFPLGTKFSGKRMGILGMGRIGREIASRALAFKMTVCYHTRRKAPVPFTHYDDLPDLARNSDFLGTPNNTNPTSLNVLITFGHAVMQSLSVLEVLPHSTLLMLQCWMLLDLKGSSLM